MSDAVACFATDATVIDIEPVVVLVGVMDEIVTPGTSTTDALVVWHTGAATPHA